MRQQPKVLSDLTSSKDERYMLKKLFDIWLIARRDWLEAASRKVFWVGILLGPVLFVFYILLISEFDDEVMSLDSHPTWKPRYFVIDHTDSVGAEIAEVILREHVTTPNPNYLRYEELKGDYTESELFEKIYLETLDGYFVIPPDFSSSNRNVRFVSNKFYRDGVQDWYEEKASLVYGDITIVETTIDEEAARAKPQHGSVNTSNPDDKPATSESRRKEVSDFIATIAAGVYFLVLLSAVFLGNSLLLSATVEEKSSHIVEVILSNVSATQLMDGKLVGAALIFFTIAGVFVVFGAAIGGLSSGLIVHMMASGFTDIMFSFFSPIYVTNFLIYFVLGFAFYGYILSAFGSLCSNIRELQPFSVVIVVLFMVIGLFSFWIVANPESPIVGVLSFFPPLTPFIMTALTGSFPDWYIYLLNLLVMVVATVGVRLLAGRIYHRGIIAESKPKN